MINPMLCLEGSVDRLTSEEWAFEGKWDGYRLIVEVKDGAFTLTSRKPRDVTSEFTKLACLAEQLEGFNIVLDGEAVALDDNGVAQFNCIQLHRSWPRVEFWAFDILEIDGQSTTRFSYNDRRRLLEKVSEVTGIHVPPLIPCDNGADAMTYSGERGWEGVVAKRRTSRYDQGRRSSDWLKDKHWKEMEVIVCGWTPGKGNRENTIGSLLMGVPDGDGGIQFVGRVGTGFNEADLAHLQRVLEPLVVSESPYNAPIPRADQRIATYVKPQLVAEVRYGLQTDDKRLRFPSWRGLRSDKTINTMN